jgi:hypothetical protein
MDWEAWSHAVWRRLLSGFAHVDSPVASLGDGTVHASRTARRSSVLMRRR